MLYFEDVPVGYSSMVGTYELTESEVVEFAQAWDPQPFHIDREAASKSVFNGLVASSLHLFAICTKLFFHHVDQIQILAMLGKDEIRIHHPARPGDTLTYSTNCVEHRPSSSKLDRGIIVLADELRNQSDELILSQKVSLLVKRKPS